MKKGELTTGENTTVERWYLEWKSLYKDIAGLTSKSLGMYDEKFNGYIKPAIGKMKWKDVDFEANKIHVYKSAESGSTVIKDTKTPASIETFQFTPNSGQSFLEQRVSRSNLCSQQEPEIGKTPAAFCTFGNHLSGHSTFKWGKLYRNKIIEHAIAENLTPYCLRHTFCTDLEAAGVPINVAKVLMGHSDISVTANIYTHKNNVVLHSGIAKLDGSETKKQKETASIQYS